MERVKWQKSRELGSQQGREGGKGGSEMPNNRRNRQHIGWRPMM